MSKAWTTVSMFIIVVLSITSQTSLCSNPYNDVELSVVVILANDSQNVPLEQGTGFFINREGDIITNLHNIIEGSSKVNVKTSNGHFYPVKSVLAKDISSDLACLSVDIPTQLVVVHTNS
jgi:S1-C subfamily serine protease